MMTGLNVTVGRWNPFDQTQYVGSISVRAKKIWDTVWFKKKYLLLLSRFFSFKIIPKKLGF